VRELAFAITEDLEELLAEHDIMVPSADREGREEEVCIYGAEYYLLEDAITDILVKGSRRIGRMPKAREVASRMMAEFEKMPEYHETTVPSDNPARATSQLALCSPEWDGLRHRIVKLLPHKTATAGRR
jgi:hypothetical protein